MLSENPNAISLLEKNPDKINWIMLSRNPSIFVDYTVLAIERNAVILQELMEVTWHPKRMRQWCLEHDDEFFLN